MRAGWDFGNAVLQRLRESEGAERAATGHHLPDCCEGSGGRRAGTKTKCDSVEHDPSVFFFFLKYYSCFPSAVCACPCPLYFLPLATSVMTITLALDNDSGLGLHFFSYFPF